MFCARCTSPLNVVALRDLTAADRARCFRALAEVIAASPELIESPEDDRDRELFDAYLNAVWLRPETALIQYAEACGLRSILAEASLPEGPHVDLGCGDGVHAALYTGWRFPADFDVFQSLDLSARDMFDCFDPRRFRAVARRTEPAARALIGLDIKPTAIARATALGAFDRVDRADAAALPLADASVASVFSNMLRDLGDTLPAALAEVRRALRPGGLLVLSAMTPAYRDALYFAPLAERAMQSGDRAAAEALLRLDRGRSVFCRQQLPPERWAELLAAAGLELVEARPIVGPHAIRFWDVGLRPFAVPVIEQAERWRAKGVLAEVKPAIVAALSLALEPLRRAIDSGEPCMRLIVARRGG
jgi:SAM-dependent methyltransferase